ncbi:MAG: hypothetical protein HZA58_07225 [Acidimicrobiia bacterium]|nr:hypothetical protein [Acidimicrobiia bacterium]
MGQQPNIPLGIEDLPRHTPHPPAPGRWRPDRPGDLRTPGEVPYGVGFGTPGPDTGYALRLLRDRDLPGGTERRADVTAAVAAVMGARAAALGRAPVPADVDAAITLLALDDAAASRLAGVAHDHARLRALVEAIPAHRLVLPASRLSA